MAVVQISQILIRSGYQEDLPQLATGEFGWCVDTQRLFIGKGTLAEGAPETGNTEIITEYNIAFLVDEFNSLSANVATFIGNVIAIENAIGNLVPTSFTLANNQSIIANIAPIVIEAYGARDLNYRIKMNANVRSGTISVVHNQGNSISWSDDYVESGDTGVTLYITGNTITKIANLGYTSVETGLTGNLTYYLQSFT